MPSSPCNFFQPPLFPNCKNGKQPPLSRRYCQDLREVPLVAEDFEADDVAPAEPVFVPAEAASNPDFAEVLLLPLFAGEEIYTKDGAMGGGNFSVLRELDQTGALLAKGSMRHEYPHSWRSKAKLIYRATPQWFIPMDAPSGRPSTSLGTSG